MTVDLLANRKRLNENSGSFCIGLAINVILRLTLRRVLTESLELIFLCENIAIVQIININNTILHSF